MKSIFTLLVLVISQILYGQTPVKLNIHHKLGTANFAYNQVAQNNMANGLFKLDRMEYYLTQFSIIHDGGNITQVPSTVVALVKADQATSIALGNFNITNIEGIKFHVGVHTPVNHEDPSLLPTTSPLSFQSPSMHWGWTSGYRFIALEGVAGASLNQTVELHALGDVNYLETTVMALGTMSGGEYQINIDADYTRGLENIVLSSGIVVHGETQQAAQMVTNFKNYVFSASGTLNGLSENVAESVQIYPIPNNGTFTIKIPENFSGNRILAFNSKGQLLEEFSLSFGENQLSLNSDTKGLVLLEFYRGDSKLFSKQVIVK